MSDLLFGKALNWSCWDSRDVVTAMLQLLLTDWAERRSTKVRLTRVQDVTDYPKLLKRNDVGLAVWALWDDEVLEQVCISLASAQNLSRPPVRICFIAPEHAEHAGLLTEAGGQVVVSYLPALQSALPHILDSCRLSSRGYHPLTNGLVERLPWSSSTAP